VRWPARWWPRRRTRVCLRRDETQLRQREAEQAVRLSRASRRAAEDALPEVQRVAAQLRGMRQRNHFAESIRRAIEEGW